MTQRISSHLSAPSGKQGRNLTDYEKIEAAFSELRRQGFIADQNVRCCYDAGWSEVEELRALRPAGFVFSCGYGHDFAYFGMRGPVPGGDWPEKLTKHEETAFGQALEKAWENPTDLVEDLYLAWETPDGDPTPIVEIFEAQGFEVEAPMAADAAMRIVRPIRAARLRAAIAEATSGRSVS